MSEQEKNRILEENLPSTEAIIAEYKKQGKELTESEAEQVRNRIKEDMKADHSDAMKDRVSDDTLESIAGGTGGSPVATGNPVITRLVPLSGHKEELTYARRE